MDMENVILAVDDEEPLLEAIAEYLRSFGFTVLTATSGAAAIALGEAHAGALRLVIMDVMMPDELGPVIVDQLLQNNPELRVIYLSGYTRDESMYDGISKLPMAMLQKPCLLSELLRTVRNLLNFRDVVDAPEVPIAPQPPNAGQRW
jgi:hypothetical protein